MTAPQVCSNFVVATFALRTGDYRGFSQAITAEMKRDPVSAREIAELSALKLGSGAGEPGSPAKKMLLKTVNVLMTIAPVVSFSEDERNLTLRALSVAEAACSWALEPKAQRKVEHARMAVETTSIQKALSAAIQAGVVRGQPEISMTPHF